MDDDAELPVLLQTKDGVWGPAGDEEPARPVVEQAVGNRARHLYEDSALGERAVRPEREDADARTVEQDHAVEVVLEAEPERRRRLAALRRRSEAPTREQAGRGRKDRSPKKLVGLKIGASQIAAAKIANNGAPELLEVVREPLEPGLVVSGEIRDPDALGEALKRFFDLHKLPKRGIRLGLSNNRIGVRVFEIEGVTDPQQLDNAIRFRAEEVLPIPLDQAVLDYVVLDDEARADGTSVKRILLVVAGASLSMSLEVVALALAVLLVQLVSPAITHPFPVSAGLVAIALIFDVIRGGGV